MSVTPVGTRRTYSAQVAAEIKAWMGRLDVRQAELARRLGQNDQWLSTRLRGTTPIDLNELAQIARALDVKVAELFPRDTHRYEGPAERPNPHGVNVRSSSTGRPRILPRRPSARAVPTGAIA